MKKLISGAVGIGRLVGLTSAPAGATSERPTITAAVIGLSGSSGFDDNAGDFDVLREALVATELAAVLDGPGPFTVFAPTDQAFLDLTGAATEDEAFATVASLGLPAVAEVLLYHVAPGRYPAARVFATGSIPTVQGEKLMKDRDSLVLEDTQGRMATVVVGNAVRARNGGVHVIDTVVLPFAL